MLYDTQYIIDADIKGCFDNISHGWLLNNVPMPKGHEDLLRKVLKTNIFEEITDNYTSYTLEKKRTFKLIKPLSDNTSGIPQGGIISPLLMN